MLSVLGGFTKQSPVPETDTSFPSRRVTRVLERTIRERGVPTRFAVLRPGNNLSSDARRKYPHGHMAMRNITSNALMSHGDMESPYSSRVRTAVATCLAFLHSRYGRGAAASGQPCGLASLGLDPAAPVPHNNLPGRRNQKGNHAKIFMHASRRRIGSGQCCWIGQQPGTTRAIRFGHWGSWRAREAAWKSPWRPSVMRSRNAPEAIATAAFLPTKPKSPSHRGRRRSRQ